MDLITNNTSDFQSIPPAKHTLSFFGKGVEYAILFFKNLFLTIITLGLYYPWAKVEMLRYYYQSTEFKGNRFVFHGTGKEVFRGFIKVYVIVIALNLFMQYGVSSGKGGVAIVAFLLFYSVIFMLIPLAIHGAARYRSSRSSWRGIHFKYNGIRKEMVKLCVKGFLLTLVTFGIYGAWLQVDLRKYILSHLKFGNISFAFKGSGADLFVIHLKGMFLSYITLGIYTFWYMRDVYRFNVNNVQVFQEGRQIDAKFKAEAGDVFELLFVNALLIIFTLGLASPWVTMRTLSFFVENIELEGAFNADGILQAEGDDYGDATGDDFLDFFDLDIL